MKQHIVNDHTNWAIAEQNLEKPLEAKKLISIES